MSKTIPTQLINRYNDDLLAYYLKIDITRELIAKKYYEPFF